MSTYSVGARAGHGYTQQMNRTLLIFLILRPLSPSEIITEYHSCNDWVANRHTTVLLAMCEIQLAVRAGAHKDSHLIEFTLYTTMCPKK